MKNFLNLIVLSFFAFSCGLAQFEYNSDFEVASTPNSGLYLPDNVAQVSLKIADSSLAVNKLENIFGPLEEAEKAYIDNPALLGGTKDPYNGDGANSKGALHPAANPSRSSLVVKACDSIVQRDAAIETAVTRTGEVGTVSAAQKLSALPTKEDIKSIVALFTSGREFSDEVLESLMNVSQSAFQQSQSTRDAWSFVFLTMCLDPNWQIM